MKLMTTNYPPLRLAVLTGLKGIKDDLSILDSPECPYDKETVETLKELLAPKIETVTIEKEVSVANGRGRPSKDPKLSTEDQEKLTKSITDLLDALDNMGTGEGLMTNERIQITKTKAGLLDQLLKIRERNVSAARMESFMETVINILDELVSEADREIFLRKLEPYR